MTLDRVTLRVGGVDWIGWTSVRVTAGVELAARAFSVSLSRRHSADTRPIRIRDGAACELWAGGDRLVAGYVDEVDVSYDATTELITVTGRSKTGDLIDCSVGASQRVIRKRRIDELARDLAAPYDVAISMDADAGAIIPRHVSELGEAVYESIERAARTVGLLVTDTADGALLLTRAGTDTAVDAIEYGANIIRGRGRLASSERYSTYVCRGQSVADDEVNGVAAAHIEADAADDGVDRHRLLVLTPDTPVSQEAARNYARWESANRAGRSSSGAYMLAGWRQSDGSLWRPNILVDVTDPRVGFDGVEMLITEIDYTHDESGQYVDLIVMPAAALELYSPAERTAADLVSVDAGIEMRIEISEAELTVDLGPLDEVAFEIEASP